MIQNLVRYINNLITFVRFGGIVNLNLVQVNQKDALKGKKIIVTGGSSGIGLSIAKKFIESGAVVLITGRNEENLASVVRQINNNNLKYLVWDVSNMQELESKFNESTKVLSGLDIFINNAGVRYNASFNDLNEDLWDKTLDVNLKSVFFISQIVYQYFLLEKASSIKKIINLSSMSAYISEANPYHISKAGVNVITSGLAKMAAKNNIIVNGIAPGVIATKMNPLDSSGNAYRAASRISRVSLPEEVAELALLLASDASNSIVGQTIVIDGGESLL